MRSRICRRLIGSVTDLLGRRFFLLEENLRFRDPLLWGEERTKRKEATLRSTTVLTVFLGVLIVKLPLGIRGWQYSEGAGH
jgi:hypothetical protein